MRLIAAALVLVFLALPAYAQQPIVTAQERIERIIGSLVVQVESLNEQIQKLQAELARERAKTPQEKKEN